MSSGPDRKGLTLIFAEIKTPPFSPQARREAGTLLRMLQDGESLGMPHSRPMPSIGPGCHELRVRDHAYNWRIFYRIEAARILVFGIFAKKTRTNPRRVIDLCKSRLKDHDAREGDGVRDG